MRLGIRTSDIKKLHCLSLLLLSSLPPSTTGKIPDAPFAQTRRADPSPAPTSNAVRRRVLGRRSTGLNFPFTNTAQLSYQVAAIVGAYLFVLLLTGLGLILVTKHTRRKLLRYSIKTRDLEIAHAQRTSQPKFTGDGQLDLDRASIRRFDSTKDTPTFSYPPPVRHSRHPSRTESSAWPLPKLKTSDQLSQGHVSLNVSPVDNDPVVQADRAAMNRNLEDIYAHVMAQEDAKEQGVDVKTLPIAVPGEPPLTSPHWSPQSDVKTENWKSPTKIKKKPQQLQFDESGQKYVKPASKTATFMNALRSPIKALRTPKTGVFPRTMVSEEEPLTPRHYIAGPLIPSNGSYHAHNRMASNPSIAEALSTHSSPDTAFPPTHIGEPTPRRPVQDLRVSLRDKAIGIDTTQTASLNHKKSDPASLARRMTPPMSPKTTMSTSPLSPTLPGVQVVPSATPISSYHYIPTPSSYRPSPSSAGNPSGTLPFRAYDTPVSPTSPTSSISTIYNPTKTTVLERANLLPSGPNTAALRTPWTAGAVPYSPYMPQTPVIPVTPRLVTKEERRLKKRVMPRTPVTEMVSDDGEVWGGGY